MSMRLLDIVEAGILDCTTRMSRVMPHRTLNGFGYLIKRLEDPGRTAVILECNFIDLYIIMPILFLESIMITLTQVIMLT